MRIGSRLLLLLALCLGLLVLAVPGTAAQPSGPTKVDPWADAHVPGELLVGFSQGGGSSIPSESPPLSARFDRYLTALGVDSVGIGLGDGATYRLHFDGAGDDELRAKRDALLRDPTVTFAEPNWIMSVALTPNDVEYRQQWAPKMMGADRAWELTTGTQAITVAVLDTGISPTHPEFTGRLVHPYDFVSNVDRQTDDNGHGTFTAGVAGASGNNELGVAGASWNTKLMPVKILDRTGQGSVAAFAAGIRYAVDKGAKVVNVSAGIVRPSQTMQEAVAYAIANGVVVVAASGNRGDDVPNYPAAYPNVIGVGASTRNDDIAPFSSFGAHVWVAAPGQDIVSTYHDSRTAADTYAQLSGTSAAAPYVSGTVALMLSQRGDLSPRAIREILKATAVDIKEQGLDPYSGWGRIDALHAVILAGEPPATLSPATVTPAKGKSTDLFQLTAGGFRGNEAVAVWLSASDGTYRFVRYPSTYAQNGAVRVSLPPGEPLPPGVQKVTVYGEESRAVAVAQFEITQSLNVQGFARVAPFPDSEGRVYFAQTGHSLSGAFLSYWRANGGLEIFGYPVSEEITEVSATDGRPYTVQYFERNRFELHPENAGTSFEVLLGLLGRDLTRGRTFADAQPPFESSADRVYFPETRHSLSGDFLRYWEEGGGLAIFGYPISEPMVETSPTDGKSYTVQYFERNRFELHPENPAPFNVLLGLLGIDSAKVKGYPVGP